MADKLMERWKRLNALFTKLEKKSEQAQGSINQLEKELKSELGCKTIEKAKELLEEMREQQKEDKEQIEEMVGHLEEKWADELEKYDE